MNVPGRQRHQTKIAQSKTHGAPLRRREEHDIAAFNRPSPVLGQEDVEGLLYELQVHQIELEMQCRQLQDSQSETEESRNRYRDLYESIPIGCATVNADGKICDVNPAGISLLRLSPSHHLPNFHVFIATKDVNRFDLLCREVLAKSRARTADFVLQGADGVTLPAEVIIQPARGFGGAPRLRLAFQDVSARRTAEEKVKLQQVQLERNHEELQFMTEKALSAPEEERRRIAVKLDKDPCQALDTCITDIRSLARDLDGRERQRVEDIGARLEALVRGVRGFAMELDVPQFEERPFVQWVCRYVERLSASSGVAIEFRERGVRADLPQPIVRCLFRSVQESLGNVVKHADATQAVLTLVGLDSSVEMRVVDDGRGFDLTQVLRAKKGIGLATIQERVRWLGGKVVIQSQPGKGAELTLSIPLSI
ncbi:MAG TPA: ATP-binding protein [Nitrospira sp.]|nr:ATP-binding protein [Nitrospira sp.]